MRVVLGPTDPVSNGDGVTPNASVAMPDWTKDVEPCRATPDGMVFSVADVWRQGFDAGHFDYARSASYEMVPAQEMLATLIADVRSETIEACIKAVDRGGVDPETGLLLTPIERIRAMLHASTPTGKDDDAVEPESSWGKGFAAGRRTERAARSSSPAREKP